LEYSYGQTGNTLGNPVVAGSFNSAFQYSNSQNTVNFTNDYVGRSANDVFYQFTLTVPMAVTISHCGSTLSDTYLHLLDASGNRIAYNDDYSGEGQCSSTLHSHLKKMLSAGTYYIVSEGYSQNGEIKTAVEGKIPTLSYSYDAAGNRTYRYWSSSLVSLRAASLEPEEKDDQGLLEKEEEEIRAKDKQAEKMTASNAKINIFPNPTEGLLQVEILEIEAGETVQLTLFGLNGEKLLQATAISQLTPVDMSKYPTGAYMLRLIIRDKPTDYKIIKQ
jgi:hypothetical protein